MLSAAAGVVSKGVVGNKGRGVRALELGFEVFAVAEVLGRKEVLVAELHLGATCCHAHAAPRFVGIVGGEEVRVAGLEGEACYVCSLLCAKRCQEGRFGRQYCCNGNRDVDTPKHTSKQH